MLRLSKKADYALISLAYLAEHPEHVISARDIAQTCGLPLPPYAKSGTCSYARFTEQGSIVFSDFSLNGTSNRTVNLVIPSITLDGLWLAITEVKPLPLAASSDHSGDAPRESAHVAPESEPPS